MHSIGSDETVPTLVFHLPHVLALWQKQKLQPTTSEQTWRISIRNLDICILVWEFARKKFTKTLNLRDEQQTIPI